MNKVRSNTTPAKNLNPAAMFLESMKKTFDGQGDSMPKALIGMRKKYIHQTGAVAKVKFVSNGNHGYTGIFEGADAGIVRLSSAAKPKDGQALGPGMGLKFLRDGKDSANLVSMFSVNGQTSWNFFEHDWKTWIAPAKGAALTALGCKFATATPFIGSVGMSEMASTTAQGSSVRSPKTPFGLRFAPKPAVKGTFSRINGGKKFVDYMEYMDTLAAVPKDATLFDVYAFEGAPDGKQTLIGTLEMEGTLTSSAFGDQSLFFRHQRKSDDFKRNPEHEAGADIFKCPLNPLNWADTFRSGPQ